MKSVNRVPIKISWVFRVEILEQKDKQNITKEAPKDNQDSKPDFKHFVRILNTDLEGAKTLKNSLKKIKGVGFMFANAICSLAGINKNKITGELTDEEAKKLGEIIKNPSKSGVPVWMLNRRKDNETGEDKHLLTSDLDFTKENDIKILKKIKAYRGIRHMFNLPVRGQRTKSNFRPNKGKARLGVKRAKKTGKS